MAAHSALSVSPSLGDALVILGAAGIVIPVFARWRITPVIGFILVGVLVGPHGLGAFAPEHPWLYSVTITNAGRLAPFAEFGIVLLLFSVGLELSFDRLWQMRRQVFGLGAAELFGAATILALALMLGGQHWKGAMGIGLALAMSSTALVLPIAGTTTPVGRAALAMLLFEDLALVPAIFLLGAISPRTSGGWQILAATLGWGAVVVGILMVVGRVALPRLFAQAARAKSPELLLSASLLVVIAAALATSSVGLSPIVGALIAGLLIAETEYHAEVETILAPFRGLALGVFLITVGMSLDLAVIVTHLPGILGAVVGVIAVKAAVTAVLLRIGGRRSATAIEAGVLLSSPSETTLIVLATAADAALIGPHTQHFWQIVTALGLTITPILAWIGRRLARGIDRNRPPPAPLAEDDRRAVIVGFGRVGRLVADMLRRHNQAYVALDSNPDLIAEGTSDGFSVIFGDARRAQTLTRLGLDHATAVILTMDEPIIAQRLVRRLRAQHPDLTIITRARDASHAAALYRAGASLAVPETLEASLQLSEAVLVDIGVAAGPVIASVHEKRDELRAQIMAEGGLTEKPRLRTSNLAERA